MNLEAILQAVKQHAADEAPRECCGLIVDGRYVPCRNVAPGLGRFRVHPDDSAAAEDSGTVQALVHSHAYEPPEPSPADIDACNAGSLPWLIVNHPLGTHCWLEPDNDAPPAPLIGRQFVHGLHDCYAVVRDWYRIEKGLRLRNYPRADGWWNDGQNLYRENFAAEGFVEVSGDLREGDVLFIQERAPVENHAGIYLAGGNILHHPAGRLSRVEVYGHYWRTRTRVVLRHRSMLGSEAC